MTGPNTGMRGPAVEHPSHDDIQAALASAVERWEADVLDLSHAIHADPELGGREYRAAKRVRRVLRMAGFSFDEVQPGQPTAFSARFGTGTLVVALCVEYDALPAIGHACGHNVNAAGKNRPLWRSLREMVANHHLKQQLNALQQTA